MSHYINIIDIMGLGQSQSQTKELRPFLGLSQISPSHNWSRHVMLTNYKIWPNYNLSPAQ